MMLYDVLKTFGVTSSSMWKVEEGTIPANLLAASAVLW